jgi:hypothetical protein
VTNNNPLKRIRTNKMDYQIKIRLPIDLKQQIEISARKNGRSKVAEIVFRLRNSFLNA